MKRRTTFPVTVDTEPQTRHLLLHCSPSCLPLSPQIFSASKKQNNSHIGSGQNAFQSVLFIHCSPSRHQGKARTEQGDPLPPNTLLVSYYFQLREFPGFDVVYLLVTLKGSLFQVFVQSPLELLIHFQACSGPPWSECILYHFL